MLLLEWTAGPLAEMYSSECPAAPEGQNERTEIPEAARLYKAAATVGLQLLRLLLCRQASIRLIECMQGSAQAPQAYLQETVPAFYPTMSQHKAMCQITVPAFILQHIGKKFQHFILQCHSKMIH